MNNADGKQIKEHQCIVDEYFTKEDIHLEEENKYPSTKKKQGPLSLTK